MSIDMVIVAHRVLYTIIHETFYIILLFMLFDFPFNIHAVFWWLYDIYFTSMSCSLKELHVLSFFSHMWC